MSDIYQLVQMMNSVCVPRPVDKEKPFDNQSVFVYSFDEDEEDTFDGYCWNEAAWSGGEFSHDGLSDVLFWSPAVFYTDIKDMCLPRR